MACPEFEIRNSKFEIPRVSGPALTARHTRAVTEAIENISESLNELKAGNDEVTAMMLRAAYQDISNISQQHIDEQILERIFSRFCIGK
jgi:tRNA U34 5-carboxymethylaminomethyl modifying GTPase MnmE/TrmE